ncbi:MAG: SDR family oxidoreductase [Alphaproteobacteria bacterium]|nr:SDR family oxidoreductase [Alphaproteobacteria bacterium]
MTALAGQVAIVTGATGGLGRPIAVALAAAGAKVVATGRNVERGEATVAAITVSGGEATFLAQDVTRDEDWQTVIAQTIAAFGRLDAVINNAGDARLAPIEELTLQDLEYLLDLNLHGSFLGLKHAFAHMGTDGGAVINLTALPAYGGAVRQTAYSAAKGALAHLTKAAAIAGRARGIRVNNIVPAVLFAGGEVSPGAVRVQGDPAAAELFKARAIAQSPLKKLGEPDDAARAAVFLCSRAGRHISGIDVFIDGGRQAGGN